MSSAKQSVILLIFDSARRDLWFGESPRSKISCSPFINRLAKDSLILDDHYAAGCGSAQAHMSIFTGQHPARHGVVHNLSARPTDVPSLTRILAENGYNNFGHVRASFIPPAGMADEFYFSELLDPNSEEVRQEPVISARRLLFSLLRKSPRILSFLKKTAGKVFGLERVLRQSADYFSGQQSLLYLTAKIREQDGPFFAYSTLFHPHTPYCPPLRFIEQATGTSKIDRLAFEIQQNMHGWVNGDYGAAEEAIKSIGLLYDAEMLYGDFLLERAFAQWERDGILEDTIVVLTSDHGEFLGEYGHLNHGATVEDEVFRTPCLIHAPNSNDVGAGSKIDHLTSALDLMPSLLHLTGVIDEWRTQVILDGKNIFTDDLKDRYLVVDSPPLVYPERLSRFPKVQNKYRGFSRAIRNKKFKYIWNSSGERRLLRYDHSSGFLIEMDLKVQKNIDVMDRMHESMEEIYVSMNESHNLEHYPLNMAAEKGDKNIDPRIREQLKKLGYM